MSTAIPIATPPATSQSGCAVRPSIHAQPKIVSVNDSVISRTAIARETQNHPAQSPLEAWKQAAKALVIRELLLQEARHLGLEPAPLQDSEGRRETDEEALVRQVVEKEVLVPQADEAACRRYYENNLNKFCSAPLYEVRHILLAGNGSDNADMESRVSEIIATLQREPESFAALAKLHSACPSAAQGGNLGQIGPGQTVPEFEKALAEAPVGTVCETPCRSRYGMHIIRVDRRIDGAQLPFALVKDRISAWLEEKVRHTAIHQYICILAARAKIVGIDLIDKPAA